MRSGKHAILSKELVYTHSTGLVEDKGQYLQALTSGKQRYDSIEYDAPAIQTYGSTAVVAKIKPVFAGQATAKDELCAGGSGIRRIFPEAYLIK